MTAPTDPQRSTLTAADQALDFPRPRPHELRAVRTANALARLDLDRNRATVPDPIAVRLDAIEREVERIAAAVAELARIAA